MALEGLNLVMRRARDAQSGGRVEVAFGCQGLFDELIEQAFIIMEQLHQPTAP